MSKDIEKFVESMPKAKDTRYITNDESLAFHYGVLCQCQLLAEQGWRQRCTPS